MSKQDFIVQLLVSNEVNDGIIDQSLYNFLVESVLNEFNLKLSEAKRTVTSQLKALYVVTDRSASYG